MPKIFSLISANGSCRLSIYPHDGALAGLTCHDRPLILPADGVFTLRFHTADHRTLTVESAEFTTVDITSAADSLLCSFSNGCTRASLTVQIRILADEHGFRFRLTLLNCPSDLTLEWLDICRVTVPSSNRLYLGDSPSRVISAEDYRRHPRLHLGQDGCASYPLNCSAPVLCTLSPDSDLALSLSAVPRENAPVQHGSLNASAALEYNLDGGQRLRLRLEAAPPAPLTTSDYTLPYDILLQVHPSIC